jgi:hypothetical protein
VDGTGVLRCAQDDSKNAQQQKHATAKTRNSKNKQQQGQATARTRSRSPSGMTTKEAKVTKEAQTRAAAKYRALTRTTVP